MRNHIGAFAMVVVLLGLTAAMAQAADKRKEKEKETDKDKKVLPVAVLPFSERGRDVQDLGGKVTDLLFANLIARPELFLVDREDINKVLTEQELNLSGVVNPKEATKVGQLTGAKILITGSVLQVDSSIYVVAKIIGTETTRVVGTSVKGGARDDLGQMVDKLGEQVAQSIATRADTLMPESLSRDDRIAAVKKELGKGKLPALMIDVKEHHVGRVVIDPAAETELTVYATETGFKVIDPQQGVKRDADILVVGEGVSERATQHGNLISVKARLEVKAIRQSTGEIVAIDRQVAVAVDLTEQLAGKAALQEAAAEIAERMLPKIVAPEGKK